MEGPTHNFTGLDDASASYFDFNRVDYNVLAVTGACLLVKNTVFFRVGGFDEKFPINYNDVDLCFRIHELGYYIVIRQDVIAYHHESLSRGSDLEDEQKYFRLSGELIKLFEKHPQLKSKDPYLNENLHFFYGQKMIYNNNTDEITQLDDFGSVPLINAFIDRVTVDDYIRILGWAFIPGRDDNEKLLRYVVFEDIYGKKYKAATLSIRRDDLVWANNGRMDLKRCGFECLVDKQQIRIDCIPYKIGVQIIDKDGKSYIYWKEQYHPIMRDSFFWRKYSACNRYESFVYHEHTHDICFYIDYMGKCKEGFRFEGWAFCNGDSHYLYKKSLILSDGNSLVYKCELPEKDRPDVAIANPEVKFLCKTGFDAYYLRDSFECDKEYYVIIRFVNRIDPDDIQDVVAGRLYV
jgi:hypothetical protein